MPYIEKKVWVDGSIEGKPYSIVFKRDNLDSEFINVLDPETGKEVFAFRVDDLKSIYEALKND